MSENEDKILISKVKISTNQISDLGLSRITLIIYDDFFY